MDQQRRVAEFIDAYDLESDPAYRILDLTSEVGEVAKEANETTNYGDRPEEIAVAPDELGDVLFSLLAVCESLDVDAGEALETALEKYRARLEERGSASSE